MVNRETTPFAALRDVPPSSPEYQFLVERALHRQPASSSGSRTVSAMAFSIACNCGCRIEVAVADAGLTTTCPDCGRRLVIPALTELQRTTTSGEPLLAPGEEDPPCRDDVASGAIPSDPAVPEAFPFLWTPDWLCRQRINQQALENFVAGLPEGTPAAFLRSSRGVRAGHRLRSAAQRQTVAGHPDQTARLVRGPDSGPAGTLAARRLPRRSTIGPSCFPFAWSWGSGPERRRTASRRPSRKSARAG